MSLRKLARLSTLVVLISLSSFIPYLKTNINLTSEFVDPIKNSSFEEGSGFQIPPWETYGGERVVSGDVNSDGKVDNSDLSKFEQAFGSDSSKSNWDPDCDINGNGKVDALDLFYLSKTYGKTASAYRLDGAHSWYTTSGAEYYMWQYLDSSTVNYVKGNNVTFSFWFLPESVGFQEEDNSETHYYGPGYIMVSHVTIPSYGADKRVHITNVHFDCKVEGDTGHYRITYRKEGEAEDTIIVTDKAVTNTEYQTKSHDTDIWGDYGKTITIRFWTHHDGLGYDIWSRNYHTQYVVSPPPPAENYAQGQIRYTYWDDSVPRSVTVLGDWVYPEEKKWYPVLVTTYLPPSTFSVQVVIGGKPDFKAWIDLTSLSITEIKLATETWSDLGMRMKLAVNFFEFKDYATPIDPLKAFFGIALSADLDKSESLYHVYFIEIVELNVKLIEGSYVRITNVTQSNDIDYETDPDQSQEIESRYIVARNTAIKGILTLGVFLLSPSIPYNIGKLLLSGTAFVAGTVLLKTYRSDSDYTDNPDVPAIARINYVFATGFVRFASEGALLELGFNRGTSCWVEVTAKARFSAIDKSSGLIVHIRTLEETISVTLSP